MTSPSVMSSPVEVQIPLQDRGFEIEISQVRRPLPVPMVDPTKVKPTYESFRSAIRALVDTMAPGTSMKITKICDDFRFQRRRFYDVVNVLETVGFCAKTNIDEIKWLGADNVIPTLKRLQTKFGINCPARKMEDIFVEERCISISNLTTVFMMMFFAMRQNGLDIKTMALYLSRHNGRFKTTQCKLYQISHILEAAGIITRGGFTGKSTIEEKFYKFADEGDQRPMSILSIDMLLNRPRDDLLAWIDERRREFMDAIKVSDK